MDNRVAWNRRKLLGALAAGGMMAAWPLVSLQASQARPKRVITLFQGATDTAVALGIQPLAVVESWREKPVYPYLRDALEGVELVGLETQPSLEDIALLQPDLIVGSRFRHERILPLLEQLAPVVMLDEVHEFRKTLAVMGQACMRDAQAQWWQVRWQQRISRIQGLMRQKFGQGKMPTVSVLDIREDHIRSYLPSSFAGSVLSELGFDWTLVSRQASGFSLKLTSRESLPVVNADLFFVFLRSGKPAVQQHYDALLQHPLWNRLNAPQHGRVWQVDSIAWSLSGGILGANHMLDQIEGILQELPAV